MGNEAAHATRGSVPKSFLLVPVGGRGEGMGHIARCIRLGAGLGPRVTLLTKYLDAPARSFLLGAFTDRKKSGHIRLMEAPRAGMSWDWVILDKRRTALAELDELSRFGAVACLDEGGEAREYCSYLVDALPGPAGSEPANASSLEYIGLPRRRRRKVAARFSKALVSFGGEDRENLSGLLVESLIRGGLFAPSQLTVVEGPLFGKREWPGGVTCLRGVPGLAEVIPRYDVVFTHFGLTAFEAVASGVPAILLNPGNYHRALSVRAGFPEIGVGRPDLRKLEKLLARPAAQQEAIDGFNARLGVRGTRSLSGLLLSLCPTGTPSCPICGQDRSRAVARFLHRTYRRCSRCGAVYMQGFSREGKEYGKDYFFDEYKAHYGRTYLEDFDRIKATGLGRISLMQGLSKVGGAIVDVGCAYGPFLEALRDAGLEGFGVEVSSEAVSWVRKHLGIPAIASPFERIRRKDLPRDIAGMTMWYVLEHFTAPAAALRTAHAFVRTGGLLAIATPNGGGISAKKNLRRFLQESPSDHFTIFSLRGLRKMLAGFGFDLKKVRVTGHHPERFPGFLGKLASTSRVARGTILAASRLLGLGDTFEAYAVRRESA